MFKTTTLLCVPLLVLACAEPAPPVQVDSHYEQRDYADPSDELYDIKNLPRFDLVLSDDALDDLADNPRTYTTATLHYRNEVVSGIGVRLKGEGSFRDIDEKPGFKIKFNKFNKGQRFHGLKRMTLNNNVQDPSFLSQPIAFALFRAAGAPAPRANSALVYVNGEYYGVYTNVETEDKTFLARWFDSNEGNLYEEEGDDFVPGEAEQFDLETNSDTNDRSDLKALIEAVDQATPSNFMQVVGQQLDMDHYLTYVAAEAIVGGEDGYSYGIGSRNNFRLYRDPTTDKFVLLPWGLDRALRPRADPEHLHAWVEPRAVYQSVWDARGILLKHCIASPACRQAFSDRLREVSALFDQLDLRANARALFALIQKAVYADERKEAGDAYCNDAVMLLHHYMAGRTAAIRAEL